MAITLQYANQQLAVSRQWISKHTYNNTGTFESGVFCWVRHKTLQQGPQAS
jgi:hypothetical protein